MAEYCRNEQDGELIRFENHDYMELLTDKNGCRAGCRTGLLYYRQTEYIQGGVHDDQEGFFVLEGNGWAKMGEREFPIAPGFKLHSTSGNVALYPQKSKLSLCKIIFLPCVCA